MLGWQGNWEKVWGEVIHSAFGEREGDVFASLGSSVGAVVLESQV